MWYALDIETIPDWDMDEELRPEPKLGNLKDPAKIAVKQEEWKEGGLIKAMSVDPLMNRVVSSALWSPHDKISLWVEEKTLIKNTWENLLTGDGGKPLHIITKYGRGFDIPTLLARAILLDIGLTQGDIEVINKLYLAPPWRTEHHIDLQDYWDYKLDFLAKRFLGEDKTGDGSQVYFLWKAGKYQEIADYCMNDAKLTYRIVEKVKLI